MTEINFLRTKDDIKGGKKDITRRGDRGLQFTRAETWSVGILEGMDAKVARKKTIEGRDIGKRKGLKKGDLSSRSLSNWRKQSVGSAIDEEYLEGISGLGVYIALGPFG